MKATLYQAVGDNKDELAQRLEDTAKRLLAVERTVANGVPKAAEEGDGEPQIVRCSSFCTRRILS